MHRLKPRIAARCCLLAALFLFAPQLVADDGYLIGFAKTNITPEQPLRLSGYGNRTVPFEQIEQQLWARAMALRSGQDAIGILITVDTIGLPGALVTRIARQIEELFGVPRKRVVVCFTHSHTTPQIAGGLVNLFAKPMTLQETEASKTYTERLYTQVVRAAGNAIEDLQPASLYYAEGTVTFARNRRVLQAGKWVNFGENPDGPVDHSFPLLKVVDRDGKVRGLLFNYACHCTTFGGEHNRVHGDWAGLATELVEEKFPGASALCTIGCGADANPPRDGSRASEFVRAEATEILNEVQRLASEEMRQITERLTTSFGYARLPFERPDTTEFKKQLDSPHTQVRQHAENMLALAQRLGRVPDSYAAPVQVWQFGDELSMVFLSGEVVVDYALRLKRELAPKTTWVTAYANDLFAYVASERMLTEGGYEVDGSMIYYNQPGRWATGTEELLLRRVYELLDTDLNSPDKSSRDDRQK